MLDWILQLLHLDKPTDDASDKHMLRKNFEMACDVYIDSIKDAPFIYR